MEFTPTGHFEITFTEEEVNALETTREIFKKMLKTMNKFNCDTFYGGYDDEWYFGKVFLEETLDNLDSFCDNLPRVME